jgi:hypothetical protein
MQDPYIQSVQLLTERNSWDLISRYSSHRALKHKLFIPNKVLQYTYNIVVKTFIALLKFTKYC